MRERTAICVRCGTLAPYVLVTHLPVASTLHCCTLNAHERLLPTLPSQKVKRLKTSLHLIGVKPRRGPAHTVFVDSVAEARAFRPEEYFGTPGELLDRTHNRPREGQLLDAVSLPTASGMAANKLMKKAER